MMGSMLKIIQACTSLGSDNAGTEKAPTYILDKSLRAGLEHNSIAYAEAPAVHDPVDIVENKTTNLHNHAAVLEFSKNLNQTILDAVEADDIALTIGGDHSVSIGSFFATKANYEDACILYIDAHPDCTTPSTTLTGNIHGMPVSTVLGDALYIEFGLPKYNYDEVFMIGVKDIDPAETEYLNKHSIVYKTIDNITHDGIGPTLDALLKLIGNRPLHVSLDIDGVDISEAPGTGILNKGGLSYREVSYICRAVAQSCNIVAIDQVEVNPDRDVDNKTTELAAELVISLLGGNWDAYTRYIELQKQR